MNEALTFVLLARQGAEYLLDHIGRHPNSKIHLGCTRLWSKNQYINESPSVAA